MSRTTRTYRDITITFQAKVTTNYLNYFSDYEGFVSRVQALLREQGPKALHGATILTVAVHPPEPVNKQSTEPP